jgi:hypothetical protein
MTEKEKKKLDPAYDKCCEDMKIKNMTGNQAEFLYLMLSANTFGIDEEFLLKIFKWKTKNGN